MKKKGVNLKFVHHVPLKEGLFSLFFVHYQSGSAVQGCREKNRGLCLRATKTVTETVTQVQLM